MTLTTENILLNDNNIPRGRVEPVAVVLGDLLDSPVHLLPLHFLLPLPEGGAALDHLINETAETEPVRTEGVLLVVDDLRGHVAHRPHPAPHRLALRDVDSQAEVRNPEQVRGDWTDVLTITCFYTDNFHK